MSSSLNPNRSVPHYAPRYTLGPILGIQGMEIVTGIGLTLLGSSLPALAALWRLDDASSGRLLLAVFAGSAIGALLIRPPFHRNLAAGMAMIAVSMAGLALGGGHALFFLFLLFGTGLGLAMTANSVLTGDRYRERRAAMLTLLNFSWSAGAAVSPFAVQFVIHRAGVLGLFWCMAAAGACSTLLALCLGGERTAATLARCLDADSSSRDKWQCEPTKEAAVIDPVLHFPVKWRSPNGETVVLENIRIEAQPPDLFGIPAGYHKLDPQALIERIKHSDVWAPGNDAH